MKIYQNKCKICGSLFESHSPNTKICEKDHIQTCPECGAEEVWNKTSPFEICKCCRTKRAVARRKATMIEKYGAPTTLQCPSLKAKVDATNEQVYGFANPMQNKQVQKKAQETNIELYGVRNVMSNPEIAMKSAASRADHMDEIVEHMKQTFMLHYGVDNPSKVPEILDKITNTFMERYGVKRAVSVPEFHDKMVATMLERHNVPYYVMSEKYTSEGHFRVSKINERVSEQLTSANISHQLEFRIGRKQYDIYIPESNILLEINPSYTHNIIGNHWNKNGLEESYHIDKTNIAHENGYRCIHVWDWDDAQKVVYECMPRIAVPVDQFTVYKLTTSAANEFLAKYDFHGSCRGQLLCIGLVKDDEIYQVMTFGKAKYDKDHHIQLMRMCTRPGYEIIGGYDRLSSEATDFGLYDIIAYSDISKGYNTDLEKLGMKRIRVTPPREIWSKGTQYITDSLLQSQGAHRLLQIPKDDRCNDQVLIEDGWLPIMDCGREVFSSK